MKYKYYLRGLGIGILVATLILTLSGKGSSKASSSSAAAETPSEEKTLAEVAAEPKEQKEPKEAEEEAPLQQTVLEVDGSAFAEDEKEYWEENAAASDVPDEESPENDEAEAESLGNTEGETEGLAIIEAETEDTAADEGETSNIVEEIIVKAPQEEEPQPENEEVNVSPGESVQVIIPKGAGSRKTAEVLKKAGLVPNAVEFDDYLCKHRYDTKIHSGAKTIPGGASYEEIAKIITTGN